MEAGGGSSLKGRKKGRTDVEGLHAQVEQELAQHHQPHQHPPAAASGMGRGGWTSQEPGGQLAYRDARTLAACRPAKGWQPTHTCCHTARTAAPWTRRRWAGKGPPPAGAGWPGQAACPARTPAPSPPQASAAVWAAPPAVRQAPYPPLQATVDGRHGCHSGCGWERGCGCGKAWAALINTGHSKLNPERQRQQGCCTQSLSHLSGRTVSAGRGPRTATGRQGWSPPAEQQGTGSTLWKVPGEQPSTGGRGGARSRHRQAAPGRCLGGRASVSGVARHSAAQRGAARPLPAGSFRGPSGRGTQSRAVPQSAAARPRPGRCRPAAERQPRDSRGGGGARVRAGPRECLCFHPHIPSCCFRLLEGRPALCCNCAPVESLLLLQPVTVTGTAPTTTTALQAAGSLVDDAAVSQQQKVVKQLDDLGGGLQQGDEAGAVQGMGHVPARGRQHGAGARPGRCRSMADT